MRRISATGVLWLLLLAGVGLGTGMYKDQYSVHTLYVYNFIRYIQWPQANPEIIIGISGGNPEIMASFEKMVQAKSSAELKMEVRKVLSPGDVAACHILFIPETESGKVGVYASRSTDQNRLIITEGKDMLQKGSMINFVVLDRKLRFEMDRELMEKAGFKVSSQLSMLAAN